MKIVKQSFAFFLVFVMLVCACPVSISAASANGEITVGNASGYPGDIVGVTVSMSRLPEDGFSYGAVNVVFGENLQYVSIAFANNEYGKPQSFSRPDDVYGNQLTVFYNNATTGDFESTDDLFVIYFRIKSNAVSSDNNTGKNAITVNAGDMNSFLDDPVTFDIVNGAVTVQDRSSALGDSLVGHSITLDGDISLNFHVSIPDSLANDPSAKVVYSVNSNEKIELEEKLSDCRKDKSGNYVLSCALPAPMWSRTVTAQIVTQDASGDAFSYSVKNYALYILSGAYSTADPDEDSRLKELCVALLNYGGYAQKHFDYFASDAANSNVYYGEHLRITNYISKKLDVDIVDTGASFSGNVSDITYLGSDIAVDSTTAIRHYFSVEGNVDDYDFYIMEGESVVDELEPAVVDGEVAVTISDIAAAYLDKHYTLKVVNESTDASVTVKYSVKTYMASTIKSSSADANIKNLIRAMYLYSEAANAYFGK